ncbi:MAG: LysR family transcriptional regulator [Oscillospiraceae bacterium]|nr:LysR family transcriptional regulator [Oscillospiraceae bacterium]
MNLSQLEQIIEVSDTGTLSQAAANLFVSQPNLSLSIKRAEEELNVKLFHRSSTGMTLTAAGAEFVDRAREILQQVDAMTAACRADNARVSLELNLVSVSHRVVEVEVARLLQRYDQNFVKINLLDSSGIKLLDHVAQSRAEIGFCTVYSFTKSVLMRQLSLRKLEYHTIGQMRTGIYVSASNPHFSAEDTQVDFDKIRSLPFLHLAGREFNTQSITDYLKLAKGIHLTPRHEITVNNFNVLRNMLGLVHGYAIAAYVDVPYAPEGFYSDVRFIPFPEGIVEAEFGCIQRENTVRSLLANELLKNIRRRFP